MDRSWQLPDPALAVVVPRWPGANDRLQSQPIFTFHSNWAGVSRCTPYTLRIRSVETIFGTPRQTLCQSRKSTPACRAAALTEVFRWRAIHRA